MAGPSPNMTMVSVGYVADPSGRGTISLLTSCFLTLVLCVWSALHLNIPPPDQTTLDGLLLSFKWILAGICAPELVVFTAWRQWSSAALLQRIVFENMRDGSSCAPGAPNEWTITHSFFACTGGFAIEFADPSLPSSAGSDVEKQVPRRLAITAKGMALLAQCGFVPEISRREIDDKSKSNNLAKTTVVLQATWMLVQVMTRLASQLPVTLLEVNTAAHVYGQPTPAHSPADANSVSRLCAFVMYMFWWHKPLLAREPVVIRDKSLLPLVAFMYSSSEMSGYLDPAKAESATAVKTFFTHLGFFSKIPELETLCLRVPASRQTKPSCSQRVDHQDAAGDDGPTLAMAASSAYITRAPRSCVDALHSTQAEEKRAAFFERRPRVVDKRATEFPVSSTDGKRWSLIKQATQDFRMSDRVVMTHNFRDELCLHFKTEEFVADHVQNWPRNDLLRESDGFVVGMAFWLAKLCYGGLHAAAWNVAFPTVAEMWLWRSSAVYIGFCGGFWLLLNFMVAKNRRLDNFLEAWIDGKKALVPSIALGIVVIICGVSLIFARTFIVVEAFISVRKLPELAYQTPHWSSLFPHL